MGFNLRRALRIRFDNRTLGNLLKNASPVAGALTGGAAGLALAGLGSAAGQATLPGSDIGDILRSGVTGAGTAGLGMAAKRGLSGLLSGGGGGATESASVSGAEVIDDLAGQPIPMANATPSAATSAVPTMGRAAVPTASRSPSFVSRVSRFVESKPTAAAMALKGLGDVASAPSENRFRDSQSRALDLQVQSEQDELERRRRLEASLEPIRIMLAQQMNAPRTAVPANPYA